MLAVKYVGTRPEDEGQFWVELILLDSRTDSAGKLGYWCDSLHLETFITEIDRALEASGK